MINGVRFEFDNLGLKAMKREEHKLVSRSERQTLNMIKEAMDYL